VNPSTQVDVQISETARMTLNNMSQLKDTNKIPTERFRAPVTSNMEYGWSPKLLVPQNPMFRKLTEKSDVTDYADEYFKMQGASPFARKITSGDA
jgi:hypothetical protein